MHVLCTAVDVRLRCQAVITPTEPRDLKKIDQAAFAGFTFVPGTVACHLLLLWRLVRLYCASTVPKISHS